MAKRPKVEPFRNPTLFEMDKLENGDRLTNQVGDSLRDSRILLGTSAFTASGWQGTFYPVGMKPPQYLSHYAKQFKTVEIDTTYYGTPSPSTVAAWYEKTPSDFIFSIKVPQTITHEKILVNCDPEFDEFLKTMDILGNKLGPIVFQFPLFDRWKFPKQQDFLAVLTPFLKKLPASYKFSIEIRNKTWLDARLTNLLGEHSVALALTDTSFVPRPWEFKEQFDLVTANFVYVRWLGDRKGIEKKTKSWDKTVIDRSEDLENWVGLFRQFVSRNLKIFAYANNHYAGHGPETVKLFWNLWDKK